MNNKLEAGMGQGRDMKNKLEAGPGQGRDYRANFRQYPSKILAWRDPGGKACHKGEPPFIFIFLGGTLLDS